MIGLEGLRSAFNCFLQHPADPCAVPVLQVWTFNDRVAFVLSVTENGQPVQDGIKLQRLRQLLLRMMDEQGTGIVSIKKVGQFPDQLEQGSLAQLAWAGSLSPYCVQLLGISFSRARWGIPWPVELWHIHQHLEGEIITQDCGPGLSKADS